MGALGLGELGGGGVQLVQKYKVASSRVSTVIQIPLAFIDSHAHSLPQATAWSFLSFLC